MKRSVCYSLKVGKIQTKAINLAQDTRQGPSWGWCVQPGHSGVSPHTGWNDPEDLQGQCQSWVHYPPSTSCWLLHGGDWWILIKDMGCLLPGLVLTKWLRGPCLASYSLFFYPSLGHFSCLLYPLASGSQAPISSIKPSASGAWISRVRVLLLCHLPGCLIDVGSLWDSVCILIVYFAS